MKEVMSSVISYGEYGGVMKQFGEWSQFRDSMYPGIALLASESRHRNREQLVQELLAQMASGSPGGAPSAAGTFSSCGEDQQTQWDPAWRSSPSSLGAESWLSLQGTGFQQSPAPSGPQQWGGATGSQFGDVFHQQTGRKYDPAFFAHDQNPLFMNREAFNSPLIQTFLRSQMGWPPKPNTSIAVPRPRRRRPSRRVPTTTLETTPSEFRALVQKFTGLKPEKSLTADAGDDGSNSSEVASKPNHVTRPQLKRRADQMGSDTPDNPPLKGTKTKTSPQDPSQSDDAGIDYFVHAASTTPAEEPADAIAQQRLNIDELNPITDHLQDKNHDDQLDANDFHYMWLLDSDHAATDYNN